MYRYEQAHTVAEQGARTPEKNGKLQRHGPYSLETYSLVEKTRH